MDRKNYNILILIVQYSFFKAFLQINYIIKLYNMLRRNQEKYTNMINFFLYYDIVEVITHGQIFRSYTNNSNDSFFYGKK